MSKMVKSSILKCIDTQMKETRQKKMHTQTYTLCLKVDECIAEMSERVVTYIYCLIMICCSLISYLHQHSREVPNKWHLFPTQAHPGHHAFTASVFGTVSSTGFNWTKSNETILQDTSPVLHLKKHFTAGNMDIALNWAVYAVGRCKYF